MQCHGRRCLEAKLDLEAWHAGLPVPLLIDVSVRNRLVDSQCRTAATSDGATAAVGERQKVFKVLRYPPTAGLRVTLAIIESWSCLGGHFEELLNVLAGQGAVRSACCGEPASRWLALWRAQFSALLHKPQRNLLPRLAAWSWVNRAVPGVHGNATAPRG